MAKEDNSSGSAISQAVTADPELAEIIDLFYQQVNIFLKKRLGEDLLDEQIEIEAEISPNFELKISMSIQADISPFSQVNNCQPILDEAAEHVFAVLEPQIAQWQASKRQKTS
jgi:hypothetical protein